MPATLRRAGSIARLFDILLLRAQSRTRDNLILTPLIIVQNACQSSSRTDVGAHARGIPGYDVRMPFRVWHTNPVVVEIHTEIPDPSATGAEGQT